MQELNLDSFKTKIHDFEKNTAWKFEGSRPAIIDFYADWCGPCRMLAPVLEEVAEEYAGKLDVYKINTETSPELAELFGIQSIPSILFVPMGESPAMVNGFLPKEKFDQAIAELFHIHQR